MDQKSTTKRTQEGSRPTGGERFINPFTDYGFKRIFGTELSKDLLIEFLNSLLPEVHIEDLTFCNVEQFAQIENDLGFVSTERRYEAPMCCTPGASK